MNKHETFLFIWILIIYSLDIVYYTFGEDTDTDKSSNRKQELMNLNNGLWISESNDDILSNNTKQMSGSKKIYFVKKPTNITVQEHAKHVRFDCQINERVNILSYKWLKNKIDINLQPDIQHRYQILQNGSLYLTQINRNDTGIYTCQVIFSYSNSQYNYMKPLATEENDNNQRQIDFISEYLRNREHRYNEELEKMKQNLEASAWLNVQYIPNIQLNNSINPIYLGRNGPGRIPCIVDATPSIDLIEWRKLINSSIKSHSNIIIRSFQQNSKTMGTILPVEQLLRDENTSSSFTIYWYEWDIVKESDGGIYQCRARNTIGWSSWSPKLQVIVNELPRFIRKPKSVEFVNSNVPLILPCEAYGQPKPIIQWFYSKLNQLGSNSSKSVMLTSLNRETQNIATENIVVDQEHDDCDREDITEQVENGIFNTTDHSIHYPFQKHRTINKKLILDVNLPGGVNKMPDGSLLIYTWNASKVTGQYFCIAKNSIGRTITSVEIKQDLVIQLYDRIFNNIMLHVKPLIYSAILSWNKMKLPGMLHSDTTFDTIGKQCYYVTYHSPVRSGDEWITTIVQPEYTSRIRLNGLIPNELYAFRINHWCTPSNHNHSTSSTVLIRTGLPLKQNAGLILTNNNTQYLEFEHDADSSKPPSPQSLKLQITQTEQYNSVLTWKVQRNPQISSLHLNVQQNYNDLSERISYFQVEFIVCTSSNTHLFGISNCTDSKNYIYRWKSLAPVRYPKLTFELNHNNEMFLLENNNRNEDLTVDSDAFRTAFEYKELNSFLTNLYYNSLVYELRFRVKSFGLMSVSEPSNELIIKHPLLPSILNALNQTLYYERYLIYKAIQQVYYESLKNYQQNLTLNNNKMKISKNTTYLSSYYITNKQIKSYWYIYCISFSTIIIILILLFILFKKLFKKIKKGLKQRKEKKINKSIKVNHQKQIIVTLPNMNILNNQYETNQTYLNNDSFNLYESNFINNEFKQKLISNDHDQLDTPHIIHNCSDKYSNHYLPPNYIKQNLLNTIDLNSNQSIQCLKQTKDTNCDQVYLILSNYENSAYYTLDTSKNYQVIDKQNKNAKNMQNTEDITKQMDDDLTDKHYAVMTPEVLRSEYLDSLHQTMIKYTLNEPKSIVPCNCLQPSSLTLYSPCPNYVSSTISYTPNKCYCTEQVQTIQCTEQQHQCNSNLMRYSPPAGSNPETIFVVKK
ncbi:unnamed protein product [Schistosoma rodhaini]|nr:unnamed protein product [Schistosoma rodhaini]